MLQYVIAGLVLGGVYAIAASALVVTYVSSGVLNFAFGALAFFIARFYYFLNTQHSWGILPSFLVAVAVAGPLLGIALWAAVFRLLRLATPFVRIVATIGLSVAIPPFAELVFGNGQINSTPGIAPQPVHVYDVFGSAVTLDQLFVYLAAAVVIVAGTLILRLTTAGLKVRALVSSHAMTSLSGCSPARIEMGIWSVSTFLAGLVGVLIGPVIGLDANAYTLLTAAAFTAVIAARLRSIPIAVVAGFAIGIAGSVIQRFMPPSSPFTAAIIPSIPGILVLVVVVYQGLRRQLAGADGSPRISALDAALQPRQVTATVRAASARRDLSRVSLIAPVLPLVIVAVLLAAVNGFWAGLIGLGAAYAVAFLTFSLVTGDGGMIWLCGITFAAVGAVTTALLATDLHVPVLLGLVAGGLIAVAFAAVLAILTIRLGGLYVAVVTLTVALLIENLVYIVNAWYQEGLGVALPRPDFVGESNRAYAYLALVIFALCALVVATLRRSTLGLALSASRDSPVAARSIGINVVVLRIFVASVAAFFAAVGGGLLSMYSGTAISTDYPTILGLTWLAVVVTCGVRSSNASLIAGLMFSIVPGLFLTYLTTSWQNVPPLLFGVGAVLIGRNPEGVVVDIGRQLRDLTTLRGRAARRAVPQGTAQGDPRDRVHAGVKE
jgi:branched-chain amino acid transport system permease protein